MRPALRSVAVLGLALALAGCGKSKERERVDHLKELCQAAPGRTIRDLEYDYGGDLVRAALLGNSLTIACSSDPAVVEPFQCSGGAAVCDFGFDLPGSSDSSVCKTTGCYFTCQLRTTEADAQAHDADHQATICGSRWDDGLSTRPYLYYPPWQPGLNYP